MPASRWEDFDKHVVPLSSTVGSLEIGSDVPVIDFDGLVELHFRRQELPKSADCVFVCKDIVMFVEFKRWNNGKDSEGHPIEDEIKESICGKIRDTSRIYNRFIRSGMKETWFILVTDNPKVCLRSAIGKGYLDKGGILDFMKPYDKRLENGDGIYFDKIKAVSVRHFQAFLDNTESAIRAVLV